VHTSRLGEQTESITSRENFLRTRANKFFLSADMAGISELITIDPRGDTVITLTKSGNYGEEVARFLVSSYQLRSASSYFDSMFQGGFNEATPSETDGKFHVGAHNFDVTAMTVVLNVIHSQVRDVPRFVSVKLYTDIVILVDYYQMDVAMSFHTDTWLKELYDFQAPIPYCTDNVRWLLLAWKKRDWQLFETRAVVLMTKTHGEIDFLGLPFPPDIMGM